MSAFAPVSRRDRFDGITAEFKQHRQQQDPNSDSASGVAGPDLGLAAAEIRADLSACGDAIMHLDLVADELRLLPPHSDTDVAEDRVDADVVHLVAPHAYIDLPLPDIDLEILHAFVGGRIRWSEGGDF